MIALLRTYLRPYRGQLALALVLLLAQALSNLYLPSMNAAIINRGVATGDVGYILSQGGLMLVVALMFGAASIAGVYVGSRVSMSFGRDVRAALFRAVQTFSQREVNLFGAPSLITRNTNDVQQVQMVVLMGLNMMVAAPIMAVGGIVMAVREDLPLSGVLVVIIPFMAAVIGFLASRALPLFKAMQVKVDRINQVVRETLAGIRVIRAFVRTDHESDRFEEANADLTDTALRVNRLMAVMMPALLGIMNLSSVAIMWFGGQRIAAGEMPIGNLTAFLTYVTMILFSVLMATFMFVMVPRAAVSADRIVAVLDTKPCIADPADPVLDLESHGTIEFEGVRFGYPGAQEPVLCGISFEAKPGEVTAVIGSTGSGKSTLINLIPRLYDVTEGAITIGGVDIRRMRREDLWRRIGFVPQKAFLFSGTIASNLRYGDREATDEQLWHALEVAQAASFVRELQGGLEAPVTQGGTNLSGGQRQRLAIARALVKDPEVYVFDDSFSALDFATDARLRAALHREVTRATTIIVAQRVSTIMRADRIIVLDRGHVVGMGTHDALLADNETYREIVFSQLSEEEVA